MNGSKDMPRPLRRTKAARTRNSSIMQKAYTEKKLTADERQYLQAKTPLSFQKIQANEQEQKAYEQELKKCRTKEDVQRLKMSWTGSSLATVKSMLEVQAQEVICMDVTLNPAARRISTLYTAHFAEAKEVQEPKSET